MNNTVNPMKQKWIKPQWLKSLLLMSGFVVICYALLASGPKSQRKTALYTTPTVAVMSPKSGSFDVVINAQGLIKPAHQAVILKPQVNGQIVDFHPQFKPGGLIHAGETIIQIDTTDYQLSVHQAAAQLISAKAMVALEMGQQHIAKQAFDLTKKTQTNSTLGLRKPQLAQVNAQQTIAQINYDQAKLALKRTALTLPFDAIVLEINSTLGDVVSNGSTMATLTRADKVWLELKVQQKHLSRLKTKSADVAGSTVTFTSNGHSYLGQVIGIRANLTSSTKIGGVIVEVVNKLSAPQLIIGSFIEATLQAGVIDNALKVPRKALVFNNQVYVADKQQKLQLRQTNILWQLPDSVIVKADFEQQDRLIISRIAGIAPGSLVKVQTGKSNENSEK